LARRGKVNPYCRIEGPRQKKGKKKYFKFPGEGKVRKVKNQL